MRTNKRIVAALIAALMTASSSTLLLANADNADIGNGSNVTLNAVTENSDKEYNFDDMKKMSEDEIAAIFAAKGMTDEKKYSVWTKERVAAALEENNIMIVLKPDATFVNSDGEIIVNESTDIGELTKDDGCITDQIYFIANSVGVPNNEVWLLNDHGWKIRAEENDNGEKIYRRYLSFGLYPPHSQGPDKSNMLIAAGLNYVQFSQRYQIIELESKKAIITGDVPTVVKGDANCDGDVDMADAVLIMQALANPNKYGENGTAENHLTAQGKENGDLDGDGLTVGDAQAIQKKLLNIKSATIDIPSSMSTVRLDDKVNVQSSEGKTVDEKFAAAEMKLGIELLKKSFAPTKKGEENLLISPMSVSAALAMTANGADGKTRSEMEKVLGNGLTLDQINEYMAYYLSDLPNNEKEKVYIADSIWFKDKPSFKVYEDFLEQNKKYYGAELYKAPFDNNTVADINDWVNRNTNGMIPSILRNGDLDPTDEKEMLMMLLNTLYFEADWQMPYTHANTDIFTDINGEEHTIKSLSSKEYEYFDLGDADAFKKPYAGGNYSFVGILPRENDIVEYVKNLDAEKLFNGLKECEDPESVDLYTMIPKFEYDYEKSLNDILKEMGMPSAFGGAADFSKINNLSVDGAQSLWIDKVLHKTKIELNEKGTKAAAVTSVGLYGGGAMSHKEKEVFIYLNRPFLYMIVDQNNVPLFVGAATQLEEK